jgi:hypothetical protein
VPPGDTVKRRCLAGALTGATRIYFRMGEWPAEKQHVDTEHNDALVADDLTLARSLGCPDDKETVSISDRAAFYRTAVTPLGELTALIRYVVDGSPDRGLGALPC